jgi:hypothetical protein
MSDGSSETLPADDPDNGDPADRVETAEAALAARKQPAGSRITIERFPDGVTIKVPPAGLVGGTQGLFVFALIWNGIVGLITAVMLAALFGAAAKHDQAFWIAPAILSIFWLVGIGVLLGSVNMGLRQAAIAVTGGTLMVIQTGLFGSKQRDWQPGDVSDVRAGPSGMTVNDKPVLELQIFDGGGAKMGLLSGRREDELQWLAYELRNALGQLEG